ncbi:MAG: cation diffusion facilitator family transporter [Phenylobacterium sp.]|uniref:cation diffusion facilitator family transporter n=1 Tax=Phenylobacterium sp. TaxID=1871053 RepID=UPI0025F7D5F2|nr:cation transporter [Phenylobacterium sp.]MBA4014241.1 cation diffusion facilitator family transporter [Phenylobacterium sp.]
MTPPTPHPSGPHPSAKEERLLATSMATTIVFAVASIGFGLWLGSKSVTFDGFYDLIDAAMTAIALLTVRLIARGDDRRFQYGYWHLEPMLALLNGLVLSFACVYAFLDGLNGLLAGGRYVQFGLGAVYAGLSSVLSFGMFAYVRSSARHLHSQMLDVDSRSWLMGGVLSAGLCLSFLIGKALTGSGAEWMTPYVDPMILVIVAVCLVPFPALTLWRASQDILMIAPSALDQQIQELAGEVAARYGFSSFSSHVVRSGRQQFIEIGFVAPSGQTTMSFEQLDTIRREIALAMGGLNPGYWLTVDFTADERWI